MRRSIGERERIRKSGTAAIATTMAAAMYIHQVRAEAGLTSSSAVNRAVSLTTVRHSPHPRRCSATVATSPGDSVPSTNAAIVCASG
ncbi:MAG TPA: hypothetical protein VGJ88_11055 [Thermoanaerobaculia bacterium]